MHRKPVIEYQVSSTPCWKGRVVKLYEDGLIQVVVSEANPEAGGKFEDRVLKEETIPPEKVRSYVERLTQGGFLGFNDKYSAQVFDGTYETLTHLSKMC